MGFWPQTDIYLPQSPFTGQFFRWRHFALLSMNLVFLRRPLPPFCIGCIYKFNPAMCYTLWIVAFLLRPHVRDRVTTKLAYIEFVWSKKARILFSISRKSVQKVPKPFVTTPFPHSQRMKLCMIDRKWIDRKQAYWASLQLIRPLHILQSNITPFNNFLDFSLNGEPHN